MMCILLGSAESIKSFYIGAVFGERFLLPLVIMQYFGRYGFSGTVFGKYSFRGCSEQTGGGTALKPQSFKHKLGFFISLIDSTPPTFRLFFVKTFSKAFYVFVGSGNTLRKFALILSAKFNKDISREKKSFKRNTSPLGYSLNILLGDFK